MLSQPASGSVADKSARLQWPVLVRLPPPKHIGSRLWGSIVQAGRKTNADSRVLSYSDSALFQA